LETQVTLNLTNVLFAIFGIIVSVFGFFIVRMVKGYDGQIKELFERTKDMSGIREAIDWLKCEIREINKK
jgi:hypothetical protein